MPPDFAATGYSTSGEVKFRLCYLDCDPIEKPDLHKLSHGPPKEQDLLRGTACLANLHVRLLNGAYVLLVPRAGGDIRLLRTDAEGRLVQVKADDLGGAAAPAYDAQKAPTFTADEVFDCFWTLDRKLFDRVLGWLAVGVLPAGSRLPGLEFCEIGFGCYNPVEYDRLDADHNVISATRLDNLLGEDADRVEHVRFELLLHNLGRSARSAIVLGADLAHPFAGDGLSDLASEWFVFARRPAICALYFAEIMHHRTLVHRLNYQSSFSHFALALDAIDAAQTKRRVPWLERQILEQRLVYTVEDATRKLGFRFHAYPHACARAGVPRGTFEDALGEPATRDHPEKLIGVEPLYPNRRILESRRMIGAESIQKDYGVPEWLHPGPTALQDKSLRDYVLSYFDMYSLGFELGRRVDERTAAIRAAVEEKEKKSRPLTAADYEAAPDADDDPWPLVVLHARGAIAATSQAIARHVRGLLVRDAKLTDLATDVSVHGSPASADAKLAAAARDKLVRRYFHVSMEFGHEWWDIPLLRHPPASETAEVFYLRDLFGEEAYRVELFQKHLFAKNPSGFSRPLVFKDGGDEVRTAAESYWRFASFIECMRSLNFLVGGDDKEVPVPEVQAFAEPNSAHLEVSIEGEHGFVPLCFDLSDIHAPATHAHSGLTREGVGKMASSFAKLRKLKAFGDIGSSSATPAGLFTNARPGSNWDFSKAADAKFWREGLDRKLLPGWLTLFWNTSMVAYGIAAVQQDMAKKGVFLTAVPLVKNIAKVIDNVADVWSLTLEWLLTLDHQGYERWLVSASEARELSMRTLTDLRGHYKKELPGLKKKKPMSEYVKAQKRSPNLNRRFGMLAEVRNVAKAISAGADIAMSFYGGLVLIYGEDSEMAEAKDEGQTFVRVMYGAKAAVQIVGAAAATAAVVAGVIQGGTLVAALASGPAGWIMAGVAAAVIIIDQVIEAKEGMRSSMRDQLKDMRTAMKEFGVRFHSGMDVAYVEGKYPRHFKGLDVKPGFCRTHCHLRQLEGEVQAIVKELGQRAP